MSSKTYIKVTKIIFAVVGLVHLLRLLMGWSLVINGMVVPIWISAIGTVAAWFLAYNAFKLLGKK